MLLPGETPQDVLDDAVIERLLSPWNCGRGAVVERKAVYRFHGRVAERWRDGRVLLAGDAAHQTPPFAGQGMCSGLRDAANLAWKLAAVIRRAADPALLDTYQPEREPQVRGVIELAIFMGRLVCLTDPAAAAERDRGMLAQRAAGANPAPPAQPRIEAGLILGSGGGIFPQPTVDGRRLDDILGDGPWLIERGDFAPVDAWLGEADAVLVRPDRYVFGTGHAGELVAAWNRMVGDYSFASSTAATASASRS